MSVITELTGTPTGWDYFRSYYFIITTTIAVLLAFIGAFLMNDKGGRDDY